jgi:cellulose synthase/poly-beta-1,6-N-acetylglucosamine synthase-like glycosyltransferase
MMNLIFLAIGALLLLVTLPLVLELSFVTAANLLPAGKPESAPGLASLETVFPVLFIIVPAHNEDLLVGRTVQSLRASAGPSGRIFVVAHNCSDQTAARAAQAGAEVLVYNDPDARGKGFALRHGFEYALAQGADAVMVVDADSTVSPNTVTAVRTAIVSGSRIMQCRYQMESTTGRSSTRLAALAFRGFNVIRPRGRSRLGLSAGILGNGFAIVRPVLESIPYDAFSVVEDLEYHLHLVMAGERVIYLDNASISADFPESHAGESVQRSRWEGGRMRTARSWSVPLAARVFTGQFRLLEPLCDLAGLPLAYGVFALLIALCVPVPWLRWYAAASLAIVLAHVLCAAWAGPDFTGTLRLLLMAPFYILRKLWMIPGVLRGSRTKAAWVRTERNNTL